MAIRITWPYVKKNKNRIYIKKKQKNMAIRLKLKSNCFQYQRALLNRIVRIYCEAVAGYIVAVHYNSV